MSGILPDPATAGGVVYRDVDGNPVTAPDVSNAYSPPPTFVVDCPLTALPTTCEARIESKQINAIVSEMISLAECFDPDGPWNCSTVTNLCAAFTAWKATYIAYIDTKVAKAGDTMTGDLVISKADPSLFLSKTGPGQSSAIRGRFNNIRRWALYLGDSTTESGGNTGSEFSLVRHDDSGNVLGFVLKASRVTGLVEVLSDPVDPLGIATKQYVDSHSAAAATAIIFAPAGNVSATNVQAAIQELDNEKVAKAGDTMTGHLSLPTGPSAANAVRKDYVDNAIATMDLSAYALKASPVFTGDPQAPTPATADNDTSIATTAFVKAQGYAPLASPTFTGDPKAPTATPGDNDTTIATTAFVVAAIAAAGGGGGGGIPDAPADGKLYGRQSLAWSAGVKLAGDTMIGDLTIAKDFPAIFLNRTGTSQASIRGQKNGLLRWTTNYGSATAESGGNTGSDFLISRYDDAGNIIDTVLQINRASGAITSTGDVTINKQAPTITLDRTDTNDGMIIGKVAGVRRWSTHHGDNTAEAGGNTGSEFRINYYNDAGSLIGWALRIDRSTGRLIVNSDPTLAFEVCTKNYTDAQTARMTAAEYWANSPQTKLISGQTAWNAAAAQTLPDGATIVLDLSLGINFYCQILAVGRTMGAPINVKPGQAGSIWFYNGVGGATITTWNAKFKFPGGVKPVMSTAGGAIDMLHYIVLGSGDLYCTFQNGFA